MEYIVIAVSAFFLGTIIYLGIHAGDIKEA
jgi:hypothetical protein